MSDERSIWKELRKPFPTEVVGRLPKGGLQLDYVGHAAVTDRLLEVDPTWTWEPLAFSESGLPALDEDGNLWIRLTVGGVTRLGVGDGRNMKERIGDALRNAAMRFGVALDLWSKEELESTLDHPELKNDKPSQRPSKPAVGSAREKAGPERVTSAQVKKLQVMFRELGYDDRGDRLAYAAWSTKRPIATTTELTKAEATKLIDDLQNDLDESAEADDE